MDYLGFDLACIKIFDFTLVVGLGFLGVAALVPFYIGCDFF
jgi:hypothetical protein